MGQYYKFLNLDKKQKCERNSGFIKLMEHSYVGNKYCNDILSLLANEWKGDRVIHVGDYAEGDDGTTTSKFIANIEKENNLEKNYSVYEFGNSFEEVCPKKVNENIRYVYNLDKKEYVDLFEQPIRDFNYYENKIYFSKINSFALLVGCGNGQGGGDYRGINNQYVGLWAGDKLVSSDTFLKEYSKFKKINYIFNENKNIKKRKYKEKRILLDECKQLIDVLETIPKDSINFEKLKINDIGLTDLEKECLNNIFYKYKKENDKKEELSNEEGITIN